MQEHTNILLMKEPLCIGSRIHTYNCSAYFTRSAQIQIFKNPSAVYTNEIVHFQNLCRKPMKQVLTISKQDSISTSASNYSEGSRSRSIGDCDPNLPSFKYETQGDGFFPTRGVWAPSLIRKFLQKTHQCKFDRLPNRVPDRTEKP